MLLKLLIKGGRPRKHAEISRPSEDTLNTFISHKSAEAVTSISSFLPDIETNEVMQAGGVLLDSCLQLRHNKLVFILTF